jgi:small conductance mechanosensitive channel
MDYQKYIDLALKLIIEYTPKFITAIILLIVGLWVIRRLTNLTKKVLDKKKVDLSLQNFLISLASLSLKILLFIAVLSQVGIETTSFIAALGAAGLAIGLALQGSLSNFAGGALILFFKPFKVGDLIKAQGEIGEVKEIQILVTKLAIAGNKTAIIPNGPLANGNIINYSQDGKLRVDINIGISYNADIKKARKILIEVMYAHPDLLNDPAPTVNVSELGDSAVNLLLRPWTVPDKYWRVYFDVLENAKEALDKESIGIPFPQRDIHIYEHKPNNLSST